jgi:hypothetical protein
LESKEVTGPTAPLPTLAGEAKTVKAALAILPGVTLNCLEFGLPELAKGPVDNFVLAVEEKRLPETVDFAKPVAF